MDNLFETKFITHKNDPDTSRQAAEKMLKALLLSHGVQPWKTHDLMALLEECLAREPHVEELRASCLVLNPYSIDVRYPDPLPEPGESEGRMAVEATDRVFSAIRERLPAPHADAGTEEGP